MAPFLPLPHVKWCLFSGMGDDNDLMGLHWTSLSDIRRKVSACEAGAVPALVGPFHALESKPIASSALQTGLSHSLLLISMSLIITSVVLVQGDTSGISRQKSPWNESPFLALICATCSSANYKLV